MRNLKVHKQRYVPDPYDARRPGDPAFFLECDGDERKLESSNDWDKVTCTKCLKHKPKPRKATKPYKPTKKTKAYFKLMLKEYKRINEL